MAKKTMRGMYRGTDVRGAGERGRRLVAKVKAAEKETAAAKGRERRRILREEKAKRDTATKKAARAKVKSTMSQAQMDTELDKEARRLSGSRRRPRGLRGIKGFGKYEKGVM
jgi:hypothetical protein